jgi:hypothetical protein
MASAGGRMIAAWASSNLPAISKCSTRNSSGSQVGLLPPVNHASLGVRCCQGSRDDGWKSSSCSPRSATATALHPQFVSLSVVSLRCQLYGNALPSWPFVCGLPERFAGSRRKLRSTQVYLNCIFYGGCDFMASQASKLLTNSLQFLYWVSKWWGFSLAIQPESLRSLLSTITTSRSYCKNASI